jgi:hypothetical protein
MVLAVNIRKANKLMARQAAHAKSNSRLACMCETFALMISRHRDPVPQIYMNRSRP